MGFPNRNGWETLTRYTRGMNEGVPRTVLSRRQAMIGLFFAALASPACAAAGGSGGGTGSNGPADKAPLDPGQVAAPLKYEDSVDALLDVLVPADRDAKGTVTSPGARETSAGQLFGDTELVALAQGLGYLPALSDSALTAAQSSEGGLRAAISAALDVAASRERPLTAFSDLDRDAQLRVVDAMYTDSTLSTLVEVVRVIALVAYLGAIYNDQGLIAVGFPPSENFADGLAVSGYPRTTTGQLINPESANLHALAANGTLDDYTFNEAPPAFAVALGLDPRGDLP